MSSELQDRRYPLFYDGKRQEPSTGQYEPVINPATGEQVGLIAFGDETDVDRAVESAARAFADPAWRRMPVKQRSELLYAIGNKILENAQELIDLEVSCSGGTVTRVSGLDIPALADLFFTLAEQIKTFPFIESLPPKPIPEPTQTQVWREPVGVCGLITAWNFPMLLFSWKVAPALATGNTMVVKPAEITPTSTMRLVEIINELLPPGVLNVVTGPGSKVGEALTGHPKVDKVSFTGSTNIGKHILKRAAESLKRVTVELGGKGPGIVLPDADIERVAYGSLFGYLVNAGQACESGTRLIVHESIYDQVVERMSQVIKQIVVGNPADPGTSMGPMSTEAHFKNVLSYIESARADGARIVCGGNQAQVSGCEGGFYIEPTIIADATQDMRHVQDEIFGPVISVIKYSTTEEAIAIANDTIYGLSAGVWTEDEVEALSIARDLRAGSVWINDWHMIRTDAPFGGYKQSGHGREMGSYSLSAYTELKTVSTAFERIPAKKGGHHLLHKAFG